MSTRSARSSSRASTNRARSVGSPRQTDRPCAGGAMTERAQGDERAYEAARASGLIRAGEPLLVLLSGGADSVCLLDCAVRIGADVHVLHVNYGLRPGSDADEQFCRVVCGRLGVPLTVERVQLGEGNLQAQAREARYALADRLAYELGCDYAAAHTAGDQAETVLYRLAVSPGSRALLGMAARRGRLVRPLLQASRDGRSAESRRVGAKR